MARWNSNGVSTGATINSAGTLTLGATLAVNGPNNVLSAGTISVNGATTINTGATLTVSGALGGGGRTIVMGTLRGTGTIGQAVEVATGGTIAGASGQSLALTGGLTLDDGSFSTFALTPEGVGNAIALVGVTGGFMGPPTTPHTIDFTGTAAIGTYDLYSFDTGSPTLGEFAIGTKPSGNFSYQLSIADHQVDLIVATASATASWNTNANGNYGDNTNWSPAQHPVGVGQSATFGNGVATTVNAATITVTVNGAYTIGSLVFNNTNHTGYILGNDSVLGDGLTLANGGSGASVAVTADVQQKIFANLTLADNTTFTIAPSSSLLVSVGNIGESGGSRSLTLVGGGGLTIDTPSSYSGGTDIANGTLTLTGTGTIGSGALAVDGSGGKVSLLDLQNNQTVTALTGSASGGGSSRVKVAAGKTLTVNQTSGTPTIYSGTIALASGAGNSSAVLAKTGSGTQELDVAPQLGDNSSLVVDGGTLRLNVTTGAASIGNGVTANIGANSTLELAGTVSRAGNRDRRPPRRYLHQCLFGHFACFGRQSTGRRDRRQRHSAGERGSQPHGQRYRGRRDCDRWRCDAFRDFGDCPLGHQWRADGNERIRIGRITDADRTVRCDRRKFVEPARRRGGVERSGLQRLRSRERRAWRQRLRRARALDAVALRGGELGLPADRRKSAARSQPETQTVHVTSNDRRTTKHPQHNHVEATESRPPPRQRAPSVGVCAGRRGDFVSTGGSLEPTFRFRLNFAGCPNVITRTYDDFFSTQLRISRYSRDSIDESKRSKPRSG